MNSVREVRVKFHPEASCTDCPWAAQASSTYPATRLRSQARQHVKETGHKVAVDIIDQTSYYPYPAVTA